MKEESKFYRDSWKRDDNEGYGLSCILQDGEKIEKAGCNTTYLKIPFSKGLAQSLMERGKQYKDDQIKNY